MKNRNKKLCKWLRSEVVKDNIKSTLECTIDTLYEICNIEGVTREKMSNSLENILINDITFRQQHIILYNWFREIREKNKKKQMPLAIFKKTRFYFSAVASNHVNITNTSEINVNNGTEDNINIENELSNITNPSNQTENTRDSSPPPVRQIYSFTGPEQGAIVENFLTFAEKALYNFLVKHEKKISEQVVKNFAANQTPPINNDFRDADVLCMIKFIVQNIKIFLNESVFHGSHKLNPVDLLNEFKKNVRHKNAQGVVEDNKGRWCDLDLQRVVHLTCEVVACLGSDYKEAYTAKEEFENDIHRRWTNRPMKNISETYNQSEGSKKLPLKRKLDETDLDQMTDFILNALKKVRENNVGDKQKMMQLSLEENESLIKIWRTATIKNNELDKINKFIALYNSMFNTVSI
ncbi:hypothetical protein F8M41_009726 [Gigaspora margarita]|uniref:Uncharacterized protein n=1 Tax=Gigaspora margarita TaxID=4874 RepID=A0A8H4A1H6_GIGMA|nr:hypothetical protein F8M41_009726 [Gigaspora margarita]